MAFARGNLHAQAMTGARRRRHGKAETPVVVGVAPQQFLAVRDVKNRDQTVLDRRTAVEAAFHHDAVALQPGEDIDPVGLGRSRKQQRGQQQQRHKGGRRAAREKRKDVVHGGFL